MSHPDDLNDGRMNCIPPTEGHIKPSVLEQDPFPTQFRTPQALIFSTQTVLCADAHPLHSSRGAGSNERRPRTGLVFPFLSWELNLYLGSCYPRDSTIPGAGLKALPSPLQPSVPCRDGVANVMKHPKSPR